MIFSKSLSGFYPPTIEKSTEHGILCSVDFFISYEQKYFLLPVIRTIAPNKEGKTSLEIQNAVLCPYQDRYRIVITMP